MPLLTLLIAAALPIGPTGDDRATLRVSVPLDDSGEVDLSGLVSALAREAGIGDPFGADPGRPRGPMLPVSGLAGSLTRTLLEETLGPGLSIEVGDGSMAVIVTGDEAELGGKIGSLTARTRAALERQPRTGFFVRPSYHANDPTRPTVCLVHGINSHSGSFVHLIPVLERAGYGVVVYDYPFNRDLDETAPAFVEAWLAFRAESGDRLPWAILSHSMGALLARTYVEGESYRGDVAAMILIGPPNRGSALARGQGVLQWIDGLKATRDDRGRALASIGDGIGEAAEDLEPGSAFLERLGASGPREGVPYYILAGDVGFLSARARERIESQYALVGRRAGLLGGLAGMLVGDLPEVLDVLADGTGDGAVAVSSTLLDGAAEHVVLHVNHVELIRGPLFFPNPGPVACAPIVLRWLGEVFDEGPAQR
ncbi:esterase/lipase family protein [Tautonia plasticadhaerens]|uniref:Alpha/beta hydrolase family protein n=1 Tax=Tautonia plasticadhaerens TaxID=2527974 RepID=A0A518H768_9BACT|nr:alpha/beta fold hydrolase [Tautonia plasticadhaerens]QDV36737.1 Alpha/beta hydrolase family protein [Tautonia plasticadhaerens]